MMEYRIVEADFCDNLERAVNDAIAEGWRTAGGLVQHCKVITPGEHGVTESGTAYTALPDYRFIVAQAMTRGN